MFFRAQVMAGATGMIVGIEDDDGTGMIDILFDDDGVNGGGDTIPLPDESSEGESGSSEFYDVRLTLTKSSMGVMTWTLEVSSPSLGSKTIGGPLLYAGLMRVGRIRISRPPSPPVGSYAIDDLQVSGPTSAIQVSSTDENP